MNRNNRIYYVVVVTLVIIMAVLAGMILSSAAANQAGNTDIQKWEYKIWNFSPNVDSPSIETYLNIFGEDGWELIAVVSPKSNTSIGTHEYIFKRPLQ